VAIPSLARVVPQAIGRAGVEEADVFEQEVV